ncbi:MAG: GNAT family N-acetyltransferase [Pirellulaceae bacterium]
MFETERLILRPFTMDDVEASYQMNLEADVSRYTMDGGVVSREEIARRIRDHVLADYAKHGYGRLAVIHKHSSCFIGFSGLKYLEDEKEVDLGYRLLPDYWGKGLATESCQPLIPWGFQQLGLSRIIAEAHRDNVASIRVMEKLGFRFDSESVLDGEPIVRYVIYSN